MISAIATINPTIRVAWDCVMPSLSTQKVMSDAILLTDWFDLSDMIRRLMDQREIWVRIPARIAGIPKKVCKTPVTAPATPPANAPHTRASVGSSPASIIVAHTQPPSAKAPSVVISAIFKSLKVM